MPGVQSIWTQPIINRIEMLTTGIRTEIGIKIFGSGIDELERLSHTVASELRKLPGVSNASPERLTGAPYLDITIDRQAAARYGIDVGAIQDVIDTGIGESNLTVTIEGRRRFPARVRYAPQFRSTPEALGRLIVPAPGGAQIPLSQLASIKTTQGAAMIPSENGLLRAPSCEYPWSRVIGFCRGQSISRKRSPASRLLPGMGVVSGSTAGAGAPQVVTHRPARYLRALYFTYHSRSKPLTCFSRFPSLTGGVYLVYALG
jgi:Cu(I)/Ag(I) efflux system membrane protein CusA/SilA